VPARRRISGRFGWGPGPWQPTWAPTIRRATTKDRSDPMTMPSSKQVCCAMGSWNRRSGFPWLSRRQPSTRRDDCPNCPVVSTMRASPRLFSGEPSWKLIKAVSR
jgi:hypothetical protein